MDASGNHRLIAAGLIVIVLAVAGYATHQDWRKAAPEQELPPAPPEISLPRPPAQSLAALPPLPGVPRPQSAARPDPGPTDHALPDQNLNMFGEPCGTALAVKEQAAAMMALSLSAPCHPDERVEITHAGLRFAARTSTIGTLDVAVPALDPSGAFTVRFANGLRIRATAPARRLEDHDRVALAWDGAAALALHALEFGALPGQSGHVWKGAPRTPGTALFARGGFLTRLGDPTLPDPAIAEIYSFPTGLADRPGTVRLHIEAGVDALNCDREIAARTARRAPGAALKWADLVLQMPGCDRTGTFLILKTPLGGLNIARD